MRDNYELTNDIVLTSITALSRYNENYSVDRDGTPLKGAGVNADGRVKSFNQELRLSGDMGRFNWLLGGNYARHTVRSANDILTRDSTNKAIVTGVPRSEEQTSELQSLMRISYAVYCLQTQTH